MNDSGEIPLTHTNTPDSRPCSLTSIIPTIGMSSCRGRAEAFARSLSSKLRTLGSQTNEDGPNAEDEPIINGGGGSGGNSSNPNTWVTTHDSERTVTDLQPLRHESDSFFDFDCELESPGSPVDECEYLRLIETTSNTPHNSTAESGYACASAASSHSSSDGPYFDAKTMTTMATSVSSHMTVTTQQPTRSKLPAAELPDYVNALKMNGSNERLSNGVLEHDEDEHEFDNEKAPTEHASEPSKDTWVTGGERATVAAQEPPATGPDEVDHNMISVQDLILKELHQESEKYANATGNGHCESVSYEMVVEAATGVVQTVLHTISNGHTELGEDLLQIEVTELSAPAEDECAASELPAEDEVTEQETKLDEKLSIDVEAAQKAQADIATEVVADAATDEEAPKETEATADVQAETETETETATEAETQLDVEEESTEDADNKKADNSHTIDTTDDEDDARPQRVRRCSSLKTGKTPPGTPGRKKIVRFADVLGLDLADVKTFLDEIPTIPKSAFEDLEVVDLEAPIQLGPRSDKMLMPLFQQPGGLPTFLDAVREKQVSLENAAVTDTINQTISGSVRVRNLDFHKSVHIRYSLDGWRSFADLQANYVENSCDGFSDKFTFVLFGNSMLVGQRMEFAVRFQCKGQQFWDSNYGANYCFQCLPSSSNVVTSITTPSTSSVTPSHHSGLVGLLSPAVGDTWCSSFY